MEWLDYHNRLYFWTVAKEGSVTAAAASFFDGAPLVVPTENTRAHRRTSRPLREGRARVSPPDQPASPGRSLLRMSFSIALRRRGEGRPAKRPALCAARSRDGRSPK